MGVAPDREGKGEAEGPALVVDLDPLEVEGVVEQLDPTADERRVELVAVAVKRDGGRLRDAAPLLPEEGLAQELGLAGVCPAWRARRVARERRLLRLRVGAAVIGLMQPGREEAVELVQVLQ